MRRHLLTNKRIILSACLLIIICSQSCQNEGLQLKKIGEQVFETDFVPSPKFCGLFKDTMTGVEYLYLSNGATDKKVSFFTLDGKRHKTIDYKAATKGHALVDISIWSLDTILALSKKTGEVFAINDSGKCIKQLNINLFLPDSVLGTSPTSSYDYDFLHEKTLFFFRGIKLAKEKGMSNLEYLTEYYNNLKNHPYFIKIEGFFSQEPNLTFLIDSFYAQFIANNHSISDLPSYSFFNNSIQIISFETDCLYIYDYKGNKLNICYLDFQNKVDQSLKKYKLAEGYEATMSKHALWSTINAHFASKIYYDKNQQKFFVIVVHSFEGSDEDSFNTRSWSMLVYDKNFNPIDEIIVTDPEIRSSVLYQTSKGWYARKNKEYIKNYDPHKTHFDIYTVE